MIRIVPSPRAMARRRPSGLKAMPQRFTAVWKLSASFADLKSQSRIVPSPLLMAR